MTILEFNTVYSATTGEHVGGYIPTVEHDDTHDVLIDGGPTRARSNGDFDVNSGWDVLTGYTRQYGYRGAVMHPSETMSDDAIRAAVRDAGGDVFAMVAVEDGGDYAAAGWVVIYKAAE